MRVWLNGRELHGRKRDFAIWVAFGIPIGLMCAWMVWRGHWDAPLYPLAGYLAGRLSK